MYLGFAFVSVFVGCLLLAAGQHRCLSASAPKFNLSVNESSKSVAVSVEPGYINVTIRAVYRIEPGRNSECTDPLIIPSASSPAVISVPYILPCLCVEVYLVLFDSRRAAKCPLTNSTIPDVTDVWRSTVFRLEPDRLIMRHKCPAAEIRVYTALCWKHGSHCTVVFDLRTLERVTGVKQEYNTSAVDKHPQMCVRLTLQGSHNVSCHFEAEKPSWMAHVELRQRRVLVYINSSAPAKFSAQLCKLTETACASLGDIKSLDTKKQIATLQLPVSLVEEAPCVQVWQLEPALHGRRILCPEYERRRYGVYAVVVMLSWIIVMTVGVFIYRMMKRDTTGFLQIQRPVLLVCSSEDSVHISTVCALASILQGELGATVHLALWSQSSQSPSGMGVTDVGPLPWLYGQWDSVIEAQGNVLIIWSRDATIAYQSWWSDGKSVKSPNQVDVTSHRPHKTAKTSAPIGKHKLDKEEHTAPRTGETEPSTVVAPVFKAALTCLMGALQVNKPQQVALICLRGHNSRKDIPKAFKAIPCYCLPRQFSGLMQELGVRSRLSENRGLHCWTGFLSKVLCFWMAQQLARRLEGALPPKQTDGGSGL